MPTSKSVKSYPPVSPEELDAFRLDQGWSFPDLRDAIVKATRIQLSDRSIRRFVLREVATSDVTEHAIRKFMATRRQGVVLR